MSSHLWTKKFIFFLAFVFLFFFALAFGAYQVILKDPVSEIDQILLAANRREKIRWYEALIDRVGPVKAQEALRGSGLPFDGETHLLNHTVGEYLYDHLGPEGLIYCRDYFLGSCFHGFIIRAVGGGRVENIEEIIENCAAAGSALLVQCGHALGHGFLALEGYENLPAALNRCDQIEFPDFPHFNCYDGVFMENIFGVHEGVFSAKRWIKSDDARYPCNDPRIVPKYLEACWLNQPALMYRLFHADLARVGKECFAVPDRFFKEACFDGLARQIHPLAAGQATEAGRLCGLLPTDWTDFCVLRIVNAALGFGDRNLSRELCPQIKATLVREECLSRLR